MQFYTIIIPVYNEIKSINKLLYELIPLQHIGHEILIIDDGSNDGTLSKLKSSNCIINLIELNKNKGKGNAVRIGLKKAKFDKIIIYDSDRELLTSEINKLMILDLSKNISFVMGYRFKKFNPLNSGFEWGNFMFTSFFNLVFNSNHKDILCCAKAFYKNDYIIKNLRSSRFEIDSELTSLLTILNNKSLIPQVEINYKRRDINDGKKLRTSDGWAILKMIISLIKYF